VGVQHGERRPPGTADDQPARDAERLADRAQIGEQLGRGVVGQASPRSAQPRAALVDAHHPPARRIEAAPQQGRAAGAGPTVQHQRRSAGGAPPLPDVQAMAAGHLQQACRQRRQVGKRLGGRHGSHGIGWPTGWPAPERVES
jgi:hypothetical protein